ncbi:MAG TPA: hypothetical protein VGM92_14020, partial [Candidatus Kapabacteria bacterium]
LPITLGENFGETVEVLSGLTGDEMLVLNVGNTISDGSHVQISRTASLTAPTSATNSASQTTGANDTATRH